MKKKVIKYLEIIAETLPDKKYITEEEQLLSGEDAILTGIQADKDKDYLLTVPTIHIANHKLRLKKAYKKGGKEGVVDYIKDYFKPSEMVRISRLINSIP